MHPAAVAFLLRTYPEAFSANGLLTVERYLEDQMGNLPADINPDLKALIDDQSTDSLYEHLIIDLSVLSNLGRECATPADAIQRLADLLLAHLKQPLLVRITLLLEHVGRIVQTTTKRRKKDTVVILNARMGGRSEFDLSREFPSLRRAAGGHSIIDEDSWPADFDACCMHPLTRTHVANFLVRKVGWPP